ncbi:aminotransferase class III-fold pyridoxal phosphate-dependent enzyme [Limnochorda pilosa]|uniref:Aminotransferase III n=1 Tax=Limnochorda pilosa TaxID=1555112 RepID=A0A0K2SKH5_LIMPI|nr:aminotransferase class III-fold pyridoxal phosphate-dependent enzyme [Limnochorda pilosa]BAS27611.1 aminotransferase III [Limnochorda pilosa]
MDRFSQFVNPHLGKLLNRLEMDKRFVRGEGCTLWDEAGRRYVDFLAAYGALPFGFNPPEIWRALHQAEAEGVPSFVQPSSLDAAGELAERLLAVAPPGFRTVTFTSSGAESTEAAIKACRAATGRMGVLSCGNAFHGKTLGALSATHREAYQKVFGAPLPGFDRIPYGDLEALEAALRSNPEQYACFLVEPIQGEGGIVEPPPGYLAGAQRLCREHGVLLVVDEVQTGLGRTGRLFACEAEGVTPDVLTLAKALGGGLMPIGAVLLTDAAYTDAFAEKHSSTFAGGGLACRAGLASLDLLTRNDQELVREVARKGARLKAKLEAMRERYPRALRAVRGRGFMLGIELAASRDTHPQSLLGILGEQGALAPVVASHLLNVEGIRIAPTLNGASVLRIEPPLIASDEVCDQVADGLDRTLSLLQQGDTARLVAHLAGVPPATLTARGTWGSPEALRVAAPRPVRPSGDPGEGRFAFLVHPLSLANYPDYDRSLAAFDESALARLADRWSDLLEPMVVGETRIVSAAGRTAHGEFIAVPRTTSELLAMPRDEAETEVRRAVELARDRGARIVGLGAYTAVVTRGGLHLRKLGVAITTGNSYTVVSAREAVSLATARLGFSLRQATVAVVGATGSIGRALAILLAEEAGRMVLVGNPQRAEASLRRLRQVAAEASVRSPHPSFELTVDVDRALAQADVVVTATSSTLELVRPENAKPGAVVCDMSRPPNVARRIQAERPDVLVIDGGVVEVPGRPYLGFDFGFERGLAYACMSETMMLALEQRYEHVSLGSDLAMPTLEEMRALAARHGFRLAWLRSFDRPLAPEDWQRLQEERARVMGLQPSAARTGGAARGAAR